MPTSARCTRTGRTAKDCDPEAGAIGLRQALEAYLAQGNRSGAPAFYGLLAELEAMRPDVEAALAAIDTGFAIAEETGEHYTDPYLHRLRGEILLCGRPGSHLRPRKPSKPPSLLRRGQGARGYALLASLALAKLYRSTGRRDEAHALLAPALEGFSPTPEMPEIAEAQALLSRLAAPPRRGEQARAGARGLRREREKTIIACDNPRSAYAARVEGIGSPPRRERSLFLTSIAG